MSNRGAIVVGRGKAQITVDAHLNTLLSKMLDAAAPVTKAVLTRETEAIFDAAEQAWPVKTGRSKEGLTTGIRFVNTSTIEGFIADAVPYVYYIKGRKQGGKSTWVTLVTKPFKAATPAVCQQLASELIKKVK